MLGSKISVAIFQGIQFILIARALGSHDFGRLSAIIAMTAILLPFSGLGAANVIVIRLARGSENAKVYFGNALLVATVSGILLILLYLLWGLIFLPNLATPLILLLFGISEILITKYIDITAHVFFGFERHIYSGIIYSVHSLIRMLFAAAFAALFYHDAQLLNELANKLQSLSHIINFPTNYFQQFWIWIDLPINHFEKLWTWIKLPSDHFELWAWFHLTSGIITFIIVFLITIRQIGWPTFNIILAIREIKTGIFYSIGLSSKSIYTNIDKTILVHYISPEINGAYTAAFRLINMMYMPIAAILLASSARFFRDGTKGIRATFKIATQIITVGSIYCLILAILIFVGAPLIPLILGKSYTLSTEILPWFALLPLVLMLQNTYSDALTGADRQMVRSFFQVVIALICFGLNIILVPKFSWMGSVIAIYISQIALVFLVIGLILFLLRREPLHNANCSSSTEAET